MALGEVDRLIKLLARLTGHRAPAVCGLDAALGEWGGTAISGPPGSLFAGNSWPAAENLRLRELSALGRYPARAGWGGRFGKTDRQQVERRPCTLTTSGRFAERMVDSLSGCEAPRGGGWAMLLPRKPAICARRTDPRRGIIAHQVRSFCLVRGPERRAGLAVIVVLHDINMAARTAIT